MRLKKKKDGVVLFGPARSEAFRKALTEDIERAVRPRLAAIDRQLREGRRGLNDFYL